MTRYLTLAGALVVMAVPSFTFADMVNDAGSVAPVNATNGDLQSEPAAPANDSMDVMSHGGGGHGGGGHAGGGHPGGGHPGGGHPGGGHPGGGHPGGGHPGHGHGDGHVGNPAHFPLGHEPAGGWRGNPYFWGGHNYHIWAWGPWAPWWGWGPYVGWRLGLYYYVPEGLKCYADNPVVAGEWSGDIQYFSSEDAITSALGFCESDPHVIAAGAQDQCRIRTCVEW